jgi:ribosomal protein S18 acetylase RimI-like enzyme
VALTIEQLAPGAVDADVVAAFARLLPQLSARAAAPTRDALAAIAGSAVLLVARAGGGGGGGGGIVGALTLTLYRIPTGLQARIDDVIVDGAARGAGIGEALSREAIARARAAGALAIGLTSHASRDAANRLYVRLGFERRETNMYRLALRAD